jgi:hypothetical protein
MDSKKVDRDTKAACPAAGAAVGQHVDVPEKQPTATLCPCDQAQMSQFPLSSWRRRPSSVPSTPSASVCPPNVGICKSKDDGTPSSGSTPSSPYLPPAPSLSLSQPNLPVGRAVAGGFGHVFVGVSFPEDETDKCSMYVVVLDSHSGNVMEEASLLAKHYFQPVSCDLLPCALRF